MRFYILLPDHKQHGAEHQSEHDAYEVRLVVHRSRLNGESPTEVFGYREAGAVVGAVVFALPVVVPIELLPAVPVCEPLFHGPHMNSAPTIRKGGDDRGDCAFADPAATVVERRPVIQVVLHKVTPYVEPKTTNKKKRFHKKMPRPGGQ